MLRKMRRSLDGAILAASRLSGPRARPRWPSEIPLVTINRNVRGVPSVVIDSPAGIGQAAEHLISLGHREIVYVSGPANSWAERGPLAGDARGRAARHGLHGHAASARSRPAAAPARPPPTPCSTPARPPASSFNDLLAIGMLQPAARAGGQGAGGAQRRRLRRHLRGRLLPSAADDAHRPDRAGRAGRRCRCCCPGSTASGPGDAAVGDAARHLTVRGSTGPRVSGRVGPAARMRRP